MILPIVFVIAPVSVEHPLIQKRAQTNKKAEINGRPISAHYRAEEFEIEPLDAKTQSELDQFIDAEKSKD